MKTARSIEEQEARKKAEGKSKGDGKTTVFHAQNSTLSAFGRKRHTGGIPGAPQLRPYCFKPGQSGNPGGRPKLDLAAEIARAIFENYGPAIYEAYARMLRKGSPYTFQVLSDRAFGKLKESIQHEVRPCADLSDEQLQKRIAELERELGISSTPPALPPSETKPN